ncbi:hypothetical protein T09_5172 [Trichinella sp. T9]|nr:hypothetical protein T09_5172 [Trichinella sp. T9]
MHTVCQQALSGNLTVGNLRLFNKVYVQKLRQVAQYTGEYTNGRRTLEQFLEALITTTIAFDTTSLWYNKIENNDKNYFRKY